MKKKKIAELDAAYELGWADGHFQATERIIKLLHIIDYRDHCDIENSPGGGSLIQHAMRAIHAQEHETSSEWNDMHWQITGGASLLAEWDEEDERLRQALKPVDEPLVEPVESYPTGDQLWEPVEDYPDWDTVHALEVSATLAEQERIIKVVRDFEDKTSWSFKDLYAQIKGEK